jgi:hippurate hydrolase
VIAAVSIVQAMQTIVSRNMSAQDELIISVTQIHTGTADNIIPAEAYICATIRTFDTDVQTKVRQRLQAIAEGHETSFDVSVQLDYNIGYPATVNDPKATDFAVQVAMDVAGADAVNADARRNMGAEDFSFMLEKRPGCYLNLGQGDGPALHHPAYDFNDEIAAYGASFFARIVERRGAV